HPTADPPPSTPALHDALPIYTTHSQEAPNGHENHATDPPDEQSREGPRDGGRAGRGGRARGERGEGRQGGRRKGQGRGAARQGRSEEHTSELQSRENLVCRLL